MLESWFGDGVKQLGRGKRPVQFVLVFALAFLLVTSSAVPNVAQTNQGNPRDALVKEIQDRAKRDFEMGRSLKPADVRKEFGDRAKQAGLVTQEIDKTYDDAYLKAKKDKAAADEAKKVDPAEAAKGPLQNPIGWVLFIVTATLVGLFKDAVGNAVKKIWNAVNTWIYQKFSGTKLFWSQALRRYRRALVEKHGKLKIPFRPNQPLQMTEVYVPLKVAGSRTSEKVEALQAVRDHKRLMVKGQPGSGKTMLLKYLALKYGLGELQLPKNPVVILLELHRLAGGAEILPQLVEALKRDDFPNGEKFLNQALKSGQVVLLLDGLDEVNSIDRPKVSARVKDFLDIHEKCGAIITCRTQVYQGEFDSVVSQTLEVVDFTDAQIQQFLRPWQTEMDTRPAAQQGKSIQQLWQSLNNRPRIKELARNPLLLTIIAYLYCDTSFVLPHSRAEFYTKSTEILIETWDQARQTPNVYKGFTKNLVLQHLALFAQDSAGQREQDRKTLSFQEVTREVKSVLPGLNLDAEADLQPILDEIVERSGLLLRIDGGTRYQFSHLTLQEFFAAAALRDQPDKILQRIETDLDAWREVVKLWCGLANDSTDVIRGIYAMHSVMAFECLADAQNVEAELADEIIEQFQQALGQTQQTKAIEQAFGAVAADTRPRGKQVFQFLTNILETPGAQSVKAASMNALSLTNLPAAAEVLGKHYQNTPDSRQAIVRMGDLAIPELSQLASGGEIRAIDDLMEIATPAAARVMAPLLWHPNSQFAGETAWYLADLLHEPEIEAVLHEVKLSPEYQPSKQWKWIWVPFDAPPNSALPKIAAQIADLLAQHTRSVVGRPSAPFAHPDPRIAIPICAFSDELTNNLPNKLSSEAESLLIAPAGDRLNPNELPQWAKAVGNLLETVPQGSSWRDVFFIPD